VKDVDGLQCSTEGHSLSPGWEDAYRRVFSAEEGPIIDNMRLDLITTPGGGDQQTAILAQTTSWQLVGPRTPRNTKTETDLGDLGP
jgi:hypothetical protein